jgi:acetyl-CoA carboxylase biotin carboxyl carrier protein
MGEGLADQLGELLRLLDGSDVEELDVEYEGVRFVVRRDFSEAHPVAPFAVERPAAPLPRADSFVITAPVVGVFRRNAGGKGEAVLDEGDAVAAGQVVGAVEAMGMLNRIQSERAGVVREMLVRDGQPVEYGQPLLVVHEP